MVWGSDLACKPVALCASRVQIPSPAPLYQNDIYYWLSMRAEQEVSGLLHTRHSLCVFSAVIPALRCLSEAEGLLVFRRESAT